MPEPTLEAASVCGAIANLMRDTDVSDARYEGIRQAYGVALDAAGLGRPGGERVYDHDPIKGAAAASTARRNPMPDFTGAAISEVSSRLRVLDEAWQVAFKQENNALWAYHSCGGQLKELRGGDILGELLNELRDHRCGSQGGSR